MLKCTSTNDDLYVRNMYVHVCRRITLLQSSGRSFLIVSNLMPNEMDFYPWLRLKVCIHKVCMYVCVYTYMCVLVHSIYHMHSVGYEANSSQSGHQKDLITRLLLEVPTRHWSCGKFTILFVIKNVSKIHVPWMNPWICIFY